MYSSFPKRDRVAIKSALSAAWAFSAVSGVGGIVLSPASVSAELGPLFPTISSALLMIAALGAIVGVTSTRYQIEWVAAWFAASGQLAYLVTVWSLVLTTTPTRLQQAAALTSLMFFYVYRIVKCAAHARKQRKVHELVEVMTNSGGMRRPNDASNLD